MKQKNNLVKGVIIILLLVGSLAAPSIQKYLSKNSTKQITIGILQTASHSALDNTREGFIHEIEQSLGTMVKFVIKNGQGSTAHLHTLAQRFHEDQEIDLIYAIATPAAQALAQIEKQKPIIIAAVTDPYALGIITPEGNVCGICDKINVEEHITIIKRLVPSAKKIGLIYNSAEVNSVSLIHEMGKKLIAQNHSPLKIGVTSESEIPAALNAYLNSIDILWVPTDNTIVSAISYIAQQMRNHQKPLIVSFECTQALCSAGINYYQSGKQAAKIALEILIHHKNPSDLEIIKPTIEHILINKDILNELHLTIPEALTNNVIFVNEKGNL